MNESDAPRSRTVYFKVGTVEETCPYGDQHRVAYYAAKRITATGETREHDNGYELVETPLFVDAQGRVYHQHVSIDYFNNVSFRRDDGKAFSPRTERLARDLTGAPLNERTPAGPPWRPAP